MVYIPRVIRYMAPELLSPKQIGFKRSNPSKETDVYSFAMTAYKVFSSYLVARVTDKCPIPMTRSSRGSPRMVENRTVLRPFVSCPASDRLAQTIQRQASGYRIKSGTLFRAVGPRLRSPGCPFIHYIKNSHRWGRDTPERFPNWTSHRPSSQTSCMISVEGCLMRTPRTLKPTTRWRLLNIWTKYSLCWLYLSSAESTIDSRWTGPCRPYLRTDLSETAGHLYISGAHSIIARVSSRSTQNRRELHCFRRVF